MSENLINKLDEVITESKKVREISALAEKARSRLLKLTLVVGVILILILGGVLWTGLLILDTSDTIACYTTPGEPCYDRQQDASDKVVQTLLDSQIAVVECQDEADVRACVEQKLVP
jgi:hypothetical protein